MTNPTQASELNRNKPVTSRFETPAGVITPQILEEFIALGIDVDVATESREDASRDWWPLSIGWAANGQVPALAEVVLRPTSTTQVSEILSLCSAQEIPVTPAAGRSGVCGGSVPLHGGVVLDLTGLNRILSVDEHSMTLHVEAGVFGPELEAHLRATGPGYTLGHWPQSFDLSTVGGWLACRGAGQYSNRYGKIEDMVRGLSVVLADGSIISTDGHGPRSATGPNLTQMFVGSEGTLGVITEATFAITALPTGEGRGAWSFPSFEQGMDVCRRILRRGATPAVLRLYDVTESKRNFDIDANVLIVLDEADPLIVAATMEIVTQEVGAATVEDSGLVEKWLGHRNDVSALRPLWENKIVVDTIEISGPWSVLDDLRVEVVEALNDTEGTMVSSVHQSHAYSDGACLYFTFAGKASEKNADGTLGDLTKEEAYYRACWDRVTMVVASYGAAISHHHGIGMNRGRFLADALGSSFPVLEAIKGTLDPHGILNPGKLGLGGGGPW